MRGYTRFEYNRNILCSFVVRFIFSKIYIPISVWLILYSVHSTDYGSWRSFYVTSGGPRHAEYYKCSGSELRLAHCESANETASRSTSYDVGMTCSNGMFIRASVDALCRDDTGQI